MVGPEYNLTDIDRAHLVALAHMPGFEILKNICESAVEQCKVDMINADPTKPDDVMAKYHLAKAAAVFWTRVVARLNHEQERFQAAANDEKILPDITEELLR
jgi:hypothetical protein